MNELNVESLKGNGSFVPVELVKKEIEWNNVDGDECRAETYIKLMSYHTAVSEVHARMAGQDMTAHRIVESVRHADGSPVFQLCDVTGLDDDGKCTGRGAMCKSLAESLLRAIAEANGLVKTEPSESPE